MLAKPKAAKPVPGIERGDHVFIQGKDGPLSVRVLSHGKDGLYGKCDKGVRHGVPWSAVLGHKARQLNEYQVVDQGADGAILQNPKGERRFVAGVELENKASPEPPATDDDPLTGGLGRLAKALELPRMTRLPDAPILFFKAQGAVASRPGLTLKHVTDKQGHNTQRWMKTGEEGPKPQPGPAPHKHGDQVNFRHGDVQGAGKIVGSGADGVTVQDESGREHQVRHEHLLKPGEHELPPKEDKPPQNVGADPDAPPAPAEDKAAAPAPAATDGPLFPPEAVKDLPAKAAQPFKTQKELYTKSAEALTELKSWLDQGKGVCSKLGYETMGKGMDGVDWSKPGGMLFIAPLKGEKRAAEKVASDYGGDWSQLKDVVRCSIAVDTMGDIKDVVDALQAGGMKLAQQPKDRFNKPLPEGYRDLMLSVQFKNGTIGEVQVHLKAMLEAKEAGHKPYETMRSIDTKPRDQWSDEEKKSWQDAFDQSCKIYGDAWAKAQGGQGAPDEKGAAAEGQADMKKAMGAGEPEWEFRDRDGAIFRRPKGEPGGVTDVLLKGKWQPYKGDRTAAYLQSDACDDPLGGGGGDLTKSTVLFLKAVPPAGIDYRGEGEQPAPPDAGNKPLYIHRKVTNAADIAKHYRDQGCTPIVAPDDMHVTCCYSKEPVAWGEMGDAPDKLHIAASDNRKTAPLGDKGATVLHFDSADLQGRHKELRERGASHDFDSFKPHLTVSYGGKGFDKAKPYTGPIELGPEVFGEIKSDWKPDLQKSLVLFFKATIADKNQGSLLAMPVQVKDHTTKTGVHVKQHTAIVHKHAEPAPADARMRKLAAIQGYQTRHEAVVEHADGTKHLLAYIHGPSGTNLRGAVQKRSKHIVAHLGAPEGVRMKPVKGDARKTHTIGEHGRVYYSGRTQRDAIIEGEHPYIGNAPTAKVEPEPAPEPAPDYREEAPAPPADSPAKEEASPDTSAKKHFYVSAINGKRKHLVAGPYGSHEEALSRVEEVRKHAEDHDGRAHFMAWGTADSDAPIKTPLGENWKKEAPSPKPAASPVKKTPRPDYEVFKDKKGNLSAYTSFDSDLVDEMRRNTTATFGRTPSGRGYWSIAPDSNLVGNFHQALASAAKRAAAKPAQGSKVDAERAFDNTYNEGGEGFNPHRRGSSRT